MIKKILNSCMPDNLFQLYISDNLNNVEFNTDYYDEIVSLKQYFSEIWGSNRINKPISKIYSFRVENINLLLKYIDFKYKSKIFYDLRDGYCFDNDEYYCCSDSDIKNITIFEKKTKNIYFIKPKNDFSLYSIHLSQIVKEPLATYRKYHLNFVQLHSSSCFYNNKGIIMPAVKEGGKTTLLTSYLTFGADYIGNDSTYIRKENDVWYMYKNPHCLRIGIETILNNPFLYNKLKSLSLDKIRTYGNMLIMNNKIQFPPSSLNDIFNRKCIAQEKIKINTGITSSSWTTFFSSVRNNFYNQEETSSLIFFGFFSCYTNLQ